MSKKSQNSRVFVDFQPIYEWQEEQEKYILTVQLSGFTKDQINVTCKRSARKLAVQGERRLPTYNKWNRFNQEYPIPQTCDLDKLEAWWQKGVLTVTMPKEEPKTAADESRAPAPVPSKENGIDQPMKSSKDQPEAPPKPASFKDTSSINNGEKQEDHELINAQKGRHHEAAEAPVDLTTSAMKQKDKDMQSEVTKSPSGKEKEKKDHKTAASMNGLSMKNEEVKKLIMINTGVTVLVLVALGAYLSYKLRSKAD